MPSHSACLVVAAAVQAAALRIPSTPSVGAPASSRPAPPAPLLGSPPAAPLLGAPPPAALLLGATALLAAVEPAAAADVGWIAPTKLVLGPVLSLFTIAFLMRVVLSWFPAYDLTQLPWSIAAIPTEPLLKPTRKLVPPVAGVDISPLIWVAALSFFNEILTGPQGILTIMQKKGM